MIRISNRDPESFVRLVLSEMLAQYQQREHPSTLYRPYMRDGKLDDRKYGALLQLAEDGLVRLYRVDHVVLGAELTHEGIKRAEKLTK